VNSFSAQWLDLREPLDAASRAPGLCTGLAERLALRQRRSGLAIIDLGAGTGANLRYAAPLLGGAQEWLLVENDPLLQGAMEARLRAWRHTPQFECRIQHLPLDLATQLPQLPLVDNVLLTASALLDLVSEEWLRALSRRAAQVSATVWFALTYDGDIDWLPAEPEDAEVRELVNLHQRNDKGFGAALGPQAGPLAEQLFAEQGYHIHSAPSAWHLGPEHAALQHALVAGWFEAACDIAPHRVAALASWLERRRAHIDAARSRLRVGHVDMVGQPRNNGA
jgi:hypothetical protein